MNAAPSCYRVGYTQPTKLILWPRGCETRPFTDRHGFGGTILHTMEPVPPMTRAITIDEAAAQLRTSKRWLLEWLRAHPMDSNGEPFYTPVGRAKIFHQADIARIERALRGEIQCRSNSGRRAPVKRRILKSEERISESAWKLAAELTNDPSLSSKSARSKDASRSTDNTRPPKLRLIRGSQHS